MSGRDRRSQMIPGPRGARSRFEPSNRILALARPKTCRTVWATTPCEKLLWGDQEPIRPVSMSALRAVPSARTQYLAQHKRAASAWEWEDPPREEETCFSRTSQYETAVRLSTAKPRSSSQDARTEPVRPRVGSAAVPAQLLQRSSPKRNYPDYEGSRQSTASAVSSSRTPVSQRLVQLSLPKVKESSTCRELGRTHESIWTVSRAASRGAASPRVELLARPKPLSKDWVAPREPEWSRSDVHELSLSRTTS